MTQQNIFSAPAPAPGGVTPFQFESHSVRVVVGDSGEPWFVAADVLASLTLDRKGLERLDDDEKGVNTVHTLGGDQRLTVINESGLYSLILGSRKPEAKKFKKWVTSEVLPAIRKTGSYTASSAPVTPFAAEDLDVARLVALRASGLLSAAAGEVAAFLLLGLRPPKVMIDAINPVRVESAPAQLPLELLAPAPVPAPKTKAKPAPLPRIAIKNAPFGGFDGLQFILSEAGEYVQGGEAALRAAMLAHGLIAATGAPTPKGRELVSHKGPRGHHWRLGELFRFLGVKMR